MSVNCRACREFLVRLAGRTSLLPGADAVTFVDVDSLLRRVFGKQKQGTGFGYARVGGYPVLLRGLHHPPRPGPHRPPARTLAMAARMAPALPRHPRPTRLIIHTRHTTAERPTPEQPRQRPERTSDWAGQSTMPAPKPKIMNP
jgi:hypothetical protein